ncbi:MAG: class I SAM-dependent methyltransferase [Eubacterium sp.]|nr:class I SAM-dependent methyltransferase [Eubacterium sp.]
MSEKSITELGNPAKPTGEAGQEMLMRMADSHKEVTGWGLSFAPLEDAKKILDVGCGSGMALKNTMDKYEKLSAFGIDYSEVSVALSEKNNDEYIKEGRAEIIRASVDDLPFKDGEFDVVFTVESFYFWPDHNAGLCEIKRVLKDGGRFFLIADIYDTDELDDHQRENIKKYNLYNPTLSKFEELLKEAGYKDVKIHTKEGTTWVCGEGKK